MDLWGALGISPQAGLLAGGAGIVMAFLAAATLLHRRSRPAKRSFDLRDQG